MYNLDILIYNGDYHGMQQNTVNGKTSNPTKKQGVKATLAYVARYTHHRP